MEKTKLKEALKVISDECRSHEYCEDCPMCTLDDVYNNNYCSITREGDVPAEWDVEDMVK
jgi:hypothetical protein